jgi:tol-pal system protein YbgF
MALDHTATTGKHGRKLPLLFILLACFHLSACGGGRNKAESQTPEQGEVDIDKLLGTTEQEKKQSAEEQEVLRLLGINPDEPSADSMKMISTSTLPKDNANNAESEVERLQRELEERDRQISSMRAELSVQEQRLKELEARPARKVASAARVPLPGVSGEYRERYERAMRLYNQHNYREALTAFASLLATDDKNSLADNAQYWVGECYYGMGNYNQAVAEFQKVLSFTRSNKSDAALLKLGLCYIRLGDRLQARSELEQLIANYPNSEFVSKARTFLNRI